MLGLGGNFMRHLALAFLAADDANQQRIKAAFTDEWRNYAEMVVLRGAIIEENFKTRTGVASHAVGRFKASRRRPKPSRKSNDDRGGAEEV
jgi:outer membrane PBP1 activator LpoA protein